MTILGIHVHLELWIPEPGRGTIVLAPEPYSHLIPSKTVSSIPLANPLIEMESAQSLHIARFSKVKILIALILSFILMSRSWAQFPPLPFEESMVGQVASSRQVLPGQSASPLAFHALIVNDNYTGNTKAGEEGRYLGADDFLSLSFLIDGSYQTTPVKLFLHAVTSRKFGYRYDLGQFMTGGLYKQEGVGFSWTYGCTWRGDLGLESIQNGFHDFKGFPEVDLPYLPSRFGLKTAVDFSEVRTGFFGFDAITGRMGIELAWRNLPNKAWSDFGYRYTYQWLSGESFGGYRYRFNKVSRYSEFVRDGFIYGTALSAGKPGGWAFETGILFFPARNLQADATYEQKTFSYSPQIWTGISFQGSLRTASDRMSHI